MRSGSMWAYCRSAITVAQHGILLMPCGLSDCYVLIISSLDFNHMQFQMKHGNVLDAEEEVLCITIDGAGPGMEGNVARQFAFRWPLLWQEIDGKIRYPLPPGGVFEFVVPDEYVDCTFRLIVLASTLHHEQLRDHSVRSAVV